MSKKLGGLQDPNINAEAKGYSCLSSRNKTPNRFHLNATQSLGIYGISVTRNTHIYVCVCVNVFVYIYIYIYIYIVIGVC